MFISKKILLGVGPARHACGRAVAGGVVVIGSLLLVKVYWGGETGNLLNNIGLAPGSNELVRVERVVDGDTIKVVVDGRMESVRYIGIDTPETVDPRLPVECFGVEASKRNEELVGGQMVRLERDITDRDKYGRLLRYIWLDGVLINESLVAQGFARSTSYPPDVKYQERFATAETRARTQNLGLWRACDS